MRTVAVVVSWNCREALRRCLASLREEGCPAVVVDNGSSDGTPEAVRREFPGAALVARDDNPGFAAGTNAGVRHALALHPGAGAVLLVNPDAELCPGALATLEGALARDPGLGAAAPALVLPDGAPQPYAFGGDPSPGYLLRRGANRLWRHRALHDWGDPRESAPDWLSGACILARADVFRVGGLFLDEGYFLYFEDCDWCLRLRRAGWRLRRVPSARCVHAGGASLAGNPGASGAYRASLRRFYRRHYGLAARAALALLLPAYAALAARRKKPVAPRPGNLLSSPPL